MSTPMPNNRNSGGGKCSLLLSLWLLLAASSGHVVTRMRGFDGPLPFYLETGYVEVDERHGVQLFYYFARSEKDPDEDPLVLWLSGGPGCSGISGLAYEIGPLRFDAEGYRGGFPTLLYRPETSTKTSNIIFVDSPVGTGFSYATTEEGLKSSDTKAVKQLVVFLRKWLQDHPRFLWNPLYIAGDSYSGLIIPSLTLEIDRSIELGESPLFNLKGYIAGNPVTDNQFDTDGQIPYLHGMGLVSDELYENARDNCGGKYSAPSNAVCSEAIQAIKNVMVAILIPESDVDTPNLKGWSRNLKAVVTVNQSCTRDLSGQHILEPACPDVVWSTKTVSQTGGNSRVMLESADFLSGFKCPEAEYVLSYIWGNDATIQESLGVRKGTIIGTWKRFNHELSYTKDIQSTVEYHSRLATKGYAALIYSGDHDPGITHIGTQAWIRHLNLTIVDDWRPWYVGDQVAGFTRSYSSNLTFATVKGAGHVAPLYRPLECQRMLRRWMLQDPL